MDDESIAKQGGGIRSYPSSACVERGFFILSFHLHTSVDWICVRADCRESQSFPRFLAMVGLLGVRGHSSAMER